MPEVRSRPARGRVVIVRRPSPRPRLGRGQISIRPEVYARLRREAEERGVSISALVEAAVADIVKVTP